MKIELPYPPERLNPNNQYRSKVAHNRVFQQYKAHCRFLAIGKKPEPNENGHYEITITFHPSCNRPYRNLDNAIAAFKAGQDGIADAWGIDDKDITPNYTPEFGEPVKGGKVVVEV